METDNDNTKSVEDWQLVSNLEPQLISRTSSSASSISSSIIEKRISKLGGLFTTSSSSLTSSSNYYDMLLSKFSRSSSTDSSKQTRLKEEVTHNLQLLKEQSLKKDTDWEFWASVISDFDNVIRTDHEKFLHMLAVGIPASLRGMLWQIFCKSRNDNSDLIEQEYRDLLNKSSPHEKSILRDMPRTFPTLEYFRDKEGEGQHMLFNVIKAYSLVDEQVGYCQGIHFVVGCLLLNMPDEAAFCVLIKLMGQYGLRGYYTPQMEKLHERMYQFDQLLLLQMPQLHRHLEAQGVLPSMYASQWFMTFFAYRCPLDLVFRVFDLVFVDGAHIVLNFALALMKKNQQTILSLEFEALLEFFSGEIFNAYKDDAYGFVQDACHIDVPSRLLTKLSKQYITEAAKEAKLQTLEDNLRKDNRELSEQVDRLSKSYKTLEMEHIDVSQQVIQSKMEMATLAEENQELKHELTVTRQEMKKMEDHNGSELDELANENARLVKINSDLQDKLAEMEATLINYKVKYAESENKYEQMLQKLQQLQSLTED